MSPYKIRLNQFEGPLDLLLFFIQRDELDIYDIPIAGITEEFLEYVRVMEQVDLDGVGDFLYLAAMLIQIKARMLMPSPELDDDGEPIDPRTELVERLLEYIRYKEAAAALNVRLEDRSNLFTRPSAAADRAAIVPDPDVIADGSVFDLVAALKRVLSRARVEPQHEVEGEAYTIEEQQAFVRSALVRVRHVSFVDLVDRRSKAFIITTFLAILELARQGEIMVVVDRGAEDFALHRREPAILEKGGEPSGTDEPEATHANS